MAITVPDKLPRVGTTIFTVMSHLAQKTGAINLSQGFPDFPIDPRLTGLLAEAMNAGHNQYAPMAGLPTLREAIVNKVEKLYGANYDPDTEVTVTAGATQAIFTVIGAVVSSGEEVIIIDPAYDCYAPAVELFGGVPVHVQLSTEMGFKISDVADAMSARTRMLIINTPHNPAGTILREEDMLAIAELLKNTNVILLSDEVYEHIVFDPEGHASAMRYADLRERTFAVFSFGKVFHATGWKGGYVLAPKELMERFRKVHQFNVFSVNTPMQYALAEYMKDPSTYTGVSRMYQEKRDRFVNGLNGSKWRPLACEGSYFQVADYSGISELPDLEFAETLAKKYGVAAIPLSPFYATPPEGQALMRFCFAKQDSTLDKAIERLCAI